MDFGAQVLFNSASELESATLKRRRSMLSMNTQFHSTCHRCRLKTTINELNNLEDPIVQLKNDINGRNGLRQTILKHYEKQSTPVTIFWESEEQGLFTVHFLIDRKHVARYGIGEDRSSSIGGVQFAIGPHYFSPENFCTHEQSQKFSTDASDDAVRKNLHLLDEFLRSRKNLTF